MISTSPSRSSARTLFAATRELQRVNRALRRVATVPRGESPGGEAAEVRAIVAARRLALARLGGEIGDIAWILLLEAYAARLDERPVAISSLGVAGGVPRSTAHRWTRWLIDRGLLAVRPGRGRATEIALTDAAVRRIRACLEEARALSRP